MKAHVNFVLEAFAKKIEQLEAHVAARCLCVNGDHCLLTQDSGCSQMTNMHIIAHLLATPSKSCILKEKSFAKQFSRNQINFFW